MLFKYEDIKQIKLLQIAAQQRASHSRKTLLNERENQFGCVITEL